MNFHSLPLTLRQLQYAVAVADALSFRRAAERCAVSQPSLSAQIAELEGALGLRLFERGRGGVLITPAGAAVLARAREALLAAEGVIEAAQRAADPLAGTLRLGVIPTVAPYALPDLDPALRAAFPRLTLRWTEGKTAELVAQVERGDLDGAVLAEEADLGALTFEAVFADRFVLAAAASHPLAHGDGPVSVLALGAERVLLLDDGHCFRDQALNLCAAAGAREPGFTATSLTTLAQMAASAGGVTILPGLAVEVENRRGQLVIRPFEAPAPRRTLGIAWRASSPLGEPLRALARVARETLGAQASP